jgi:hypothetical protein
VEDKETIMKKTLFVLALALALLSAVPVSAQTYPGDTTLSANLAANGTVVSLASGTGVQANGALWVDGEMLPINASTPCANASCTRVNVMRTQKPQAHASGAVVAVISAAARPNIMLASSAAYRLGQCSTSTSSAISVALAGYQYLPIFDIDQGWVYNCRRNGTSGAWVWNRTIAQNVNGTAGSDKPWP